MSSHKSVGIGEVPSSSGSRLEESLQIDIPLKFVPITILEVQDPVQDMLRKFLNTEAIGIVDT